MMKIIKNFFEVITEEIDFCNLYDLVYVSVNIVFVVQIFIVFSAMINPFESLMAVSGFFHLIIIVICVIYLSPLAFCRCLCEINRKVESKMLSVFVMLCSVLNEFVLIWGENDLRILGEWRQMSLVITGAIPVILSMYHLPKTWRDNK